MARGRFISRSISQSRKFEALASDTHRLMYLLILPRADREGRHSADPLDLSGLCFTRLRYSEEVIAAGLLDLARVGLIALYEVDGTPCLEIAGFLEHNTPHARETPSRFPPPPTQGQPKADPRQTLGEPRADLGQTQGEPRAAEEKGSRREVEVEVEEKEKNVVAVDEKLPEQPATATTLENLLKAKFGSHYDSMVSELPNREKAWTSLTLEQARKAIAQSQKPESLEDSRSFRTRLKDNLDTGAGLTPNPSGGRGPGAAEIAARAEAVKAEEDALWEAMSEAERGESEQRAAEFLQKMGLAS